MKKKPAKKILPKKTEKKLVKKPVFLFNLKASDLTSVLHSNEKLAIQEYLNLITDHIELSYKNGLEEVAILIPEKYEEWICKTVEDAGFKIDGDCDDGTTDDFDTYTIIKIYWSPTYS